METTRLGKTGIMATRSGFGALPIQRVNFDKARLILREAVESGINFIDTASGYSDSEEKIGCSLSDLRHKVYIATKCSGAKNRSDVLTLIEQSLKRMNTDYIDILQLHNPGELPDPDDPESTYAGLLEAKQKGMIRFIGITNHSRDVARKAVASGLFDTLQFPLSALSSPEDFELAVLCEQHDLGFIAMKAFCGGLLDDATLAFAGLRNYKNVVPIWGIQRLSELREIVELESNPPELTLELAEKIARESKELSGDFCRACGYCLPCPVDIPIPMAARIGLLIHRMPSEKFKDDDWQEKLARVEDCIECGDCSSRCPYGLDTPNLLKRQRTQYLEWLSA